MNKSLLSLISTAIFISVINVNSAFAVKHVVNVQNYSFIPANLNVQVGDTIRWVWVNGTHTTTSTTIPSGAVAWDAPITSSNPVYEYRVSVAGVYNYLCTPHSSTQIGSFTATAPPPPTLSVNPANQNVTSAAGSTNFTVTSNSNWTASSSAGWCTVTSSGSGNGTIVANYQANTSTSQRVATITVTVSGLPSTTVTVTQAGEAATLLVTPSNQNVTSTAGSTNFNVTSNSNWVSSSNADWCSVTGAGSGNGTLVATYQENTGTSARVATITVTVSGLPSSIVTVTQAAAGATLQVSPANQTVTHMAGTTNFSVLSNTTWTASSNNDWCVVTNAGSGNGTIVATYDENTGFEPRIATITVIAGGTNTSIVTVTQDGAEAMLSVDPLNQDVTAEAGFTTFNVTSNTNWAVTSDVTWASPVSEGSGNGILVVNYEENTSSSVRIAILTVTASGILQWISITQEGTISAGNIEVNKISAYPNPSRDVLNITSNLKSLDSQVSLMNFTGRVIRSYTIANPQSFSVDVSELPSGNYILRIEQDGKLYNLKLSITH